jgi:hypothetical protein
VTSDPLPFQVARAWHAATCAVLVVGLTVQIGVTLTSAPVGSGNRIVSLLSYFTVQCSLLTLLVEIVLALSPAGWDRWERAQRVIRANTVSVSSLVLVTYLAVLRPVVTSEGPAALADCLLHYLAPVMVVAGWVVFGPRRWCDLRVVVWALCWPLTWFCWTLVHGAFTGFYPYPFVDVDESGLGAVLLRSIVALVSMTFLVLLHWWLDHTLEDARISLGDRVAPPARRLSPTR